MVAARHVTVEEFAEMPLQGIWELVDGEPIELSPAAGRSGWISGNVYGLLASHVRQSQVGWAFPPETGFVLFADRQTVRSPDAAVVLRNRLAELPDSFVPMAPDLAVEVLSPSDRKYFFISRPAGCEPLDRPCNTSPTRLVQGQQPCLSRWLGNEE